MAVIKTLSKPTYKQIQQQLEAYQKGLEEHLAQAAKQFEQNHPQFAAAKLHRRFTVETFTSAEVPFTKALPKIVDLLTLPKWLAKTQQEVLTEVSKSFEGKKIQLNVWTKPLDHIALKIIKTRIRGNMAIPINIDGCKTLSQIRKKMRIEKPSLNIQYVYSGKISLTKDGLVAGTTIYPLIFRAQNYYILVTTKTGKRQWVRIDALQALLENLKVTRGD